MLPEFEYAKGLFNEYGLELSEEQYEKLDIYAEFLVEYNEKVNLTAITEPDEILKKHFIDSVLMLKFVDIPRDSSMIAVGTGAGFPSVPIAVFRPDIKLTLLDSLNKRTIFLEKLCEKLGVKAEIIHGRAEEVSKNEKYREQFDVACARAVANMAVLSEFCLPFVKVGGNFTAMKGPNENIEASEKAVKILGGKLAAQIDYDLFDEQRKIVVAEKISQTATKYPRNSGKIKKNPL